jgi:hypothetical protein
VKAWQRKRVNDVHIEGFFHALEYEETGAVCAALVREELGVSLENILFCNVERQARHI